MLTIIDYTEKSIALTGDTKDIKDTLKQLGGKFNPHLTCGPGWIFSASKRSDIEKIINGEPVEVCHTRYTKGPAVYCGTYGKYNAGSIKGAWVDLTSFRNGSEAIKWMCEVLHKDESDPKLMFQDYQGFPEWYYRESMGSKAIDDILEWWRKEGSKPAKSDKGQGAVDEYIAEISKLERDVDCYRKNLSYALKLSGGEIIPFSKPSIKTRFCFGYSDCGQGPSYDDANKASEAAATESYFRSRNLDYFDEFIEKCNSSEYKIYILNSEYYINHNVNVWGYCAIRCWEDPNRMYYASSIKELDDKDRQAIVRVLKSEKEKFSKRLDAWWKRYGAEKLHIWTYWMDE